MIRKILTIAFAVFASAACNNAKTTTGPDFSGDRIKADVAYLADDKLEGRYTGSPGYMTAAHYVADRFAKLGLTPGNNGSWYQQIAFAQATRRAGAPSALQIGSQRFANGVDVSLYPNSAFPDQKLSGDAVFVGYGLEDPAIGADDYAGLDVRGKIAVALWGFPIGAPGEIAAHLNSEKASIAKKHGAIGLLSIYTPMLGKVLSWDEVRARADKPDLKWIGADGKPNYPGLNLPITGYIGPKAAEALFERSATPLSAILAATAQKGAKPRGFALNKRLTVERHSDVQRLNSPNVVAILRGSDPKLRDEYIVLSAHLDHLGRVKPVNGDDIANGAMDNAMGIATMLEAARAFASSPVKPKRSILFAAVTAEEEGLLGSEYLAKHPVVGAGKVVGVVNLDMPIATYDFQDVVAYGAEHSTIAQAVAKAIRSEGVKLSPDPAPEQVIFVRSDHYPFVKEGVPAISLDLGPAGPGAKATEEFITKHYHDVSDDMRLPFNWGAAAKFARINYLIAKQLADSAEPPLWYRGDYFGDAFAKGAQKAAR
jgi:hypothetical protein